MAIMDTVLNVTKIAEYVSTVIHVLNAKMERTFSITNVYLTAQLVILHQTYY